jgi:N-acetylmuramoyl-L-alanine amidase
VRRVCSGTLSRTRTHFRLRRGFIFSHLYPQLAPWAPLLRRYVAAGRKAFSAQSSTIKLACMSVRCAFCAVLMILLVNPAARAAHKSDAWARTQFATAEKMREALNDRSEAEPTRRDYQVVMMAYRRVYYGAPTCSKADAAVLAVADLLAESGRRFDDDHALRSAIGQYEFLRREYPGSRYRFEALFAIGEIYKDDLNNPVRARAAIQEFLRQYPHHHLADEARQAMAEPVRQAAIRSQEEKNTNDSEQPARVENKKGAGSANPEKVEGNEPADTNPKPSRVTDVRHWSTPDFTRVQIDLDSDVKFESQRMDRPDRLVFDLLNSRLAAAPGGKSFDVDDGPVKKIRVAQFQPGKTRVVLEVDRACDYVASLLADPPRLSVDIHARKSSATSIEGRAPLPAVTKKAEKAEGNDEAENSPRKSADEKKPASAKPTTSSPEPEKTIVGADDDDDDSAPATPNRRAIKTASKTTVTPAPVPAVLPESRRNSAGAAADAASLSHVPSAPEATRPKAGISNKRKSSPEADVHEAEPTASGDRSLIRALGLKIGKIVIDPGHGGHDTGTIGPHGLEEKDLVLEVGRRLGKLLQTRLGADVVYTRSDDTFIPLETRTAIANQEQADLFVSIHANSSHDPDARGVETYYLNFTSSSESLDVAARENAASDKSIHELQDLVKKIALKEKVEESREFAADVQRSLHSGLASKNPGLRNRGVKKAPFVVLIGANMPSILAEVSFVSNPGDEKRLRTAEYRQRIAESIYHGIAKYVSGLSGVKVASRVEKAQGQ